MPNFQQILFAALWLCAFTACSKKSENIDANKIDAFYTLTYRVQSNTTIAKAYFAYRQRSVKLTDGANLRIDGFAPDFTNNQKAYIESYPYYKPSVNFEYTDNLNQIYSNQVELTTIDFPLVFETLSTNIDLPFYWIGEPLQVNETISLTVGTQNRGDSTVTFTASLQGASFLYVSAAALRAKVPIGQGLATLTRTRKTLLQQASPAGGVSTSVYVSTRNILIN